MSFVNFSNHNSSAWTKKQKDEAARRWGEITDVPFPAVSPSASADDVRRMARECVEVIMKHSPTAVMCQGESTLTYHVVSLLKEKDVTVVSACSRRNVTEIKEEDGTVKKESVFDFVAFREY